MNTSHLCSTHPRLILFAGHAGTGKTTLAKRALPLIIKHTKESYAFLDKDTVYGAYSAEVMRLTTGNPNDRDSPFYVDNLRDLEYAGLLDIVRENLNLGVNAVLVGPFSKEIQNGTMFDQEKLGVPSVTKIRIAWIDLDSDEAKRRMELRKDLRDEWKLDHWAEYSKRRIDPPAHPDIRRFDNTQFDSRQFDLLIKHLVS